ncbi:hypothetical protein Hypma_008227 [Hypsizygus marmoreus]|uniref:Cytochrome P450 n=1 Tax=Hypsizygus marmoreus TaxID=39966 RepID=A0A369JTH5_HYPMA|nr:hypothetical protein Hypma_008227 [Hypsizygus marmoreus]
MLSAVFTLGGVHSTSGIIQWFLALIPSHPEVQARAHEELDRVIGRDRWPTAEDEPNLPYIRPSLRRSNESTLRSGWLHALHKSRFCLPWDVHSQGYGSSPQLLHASSQRRALSRRLCIQSCRYLGDDLSCVESAKLANVMERDHWTFGAGRRICPGLPVAERELWLAISRLLWSFTFHALPEEPISLEEYEGLSGALPCPSG